MALGPARHCCAQPQLAGASVKAERHLDWLGVDRTRFDDPDQFGILPMAFCYPGKGPNADLPPPPRCFDTWHQRLLNTLESVHLTLLVGSYAQRAYLGRQAKKTLTETVRTFEDYAPQNLPLPHPSWRSTGWMRRNPWFETQVLPALRARVAAALG